MQIMKNSTYSAGICKTLSQCLALAAVILASASNAFAQSESEARLSLLAAENIPSLQQARSVNDDSVQVVFHFEDYYRRLIDDMGRALEDDMSIRLIPVIGVSHLQSVYDQLYLKGMDLSIIHSDVLEYLARTQNYERVFTHINAVGTLYREKIAVIAGSKYETMADLADQEVNFGFTGKGSDLAGTILFDTLDINVNPVRLEKFEAIEKVKSGELAATVFLLEDAPAQLKALSPEDNVTVLPVPNTEELLSVYSADSFDHSEFPQIIDEGDTLLTLSASVIIASYNWRDENNSRYKKLDRFVTALMANLDTLKTDEQFDDAWKTVSFDAEVPGVQRLPMVQAILDQQEAEAQRIADEKLAEELQLIVDAQNALVERLNARIEETSDPDELESLLVQLQDLLEDIQ